jgi:4-hydroxy-3-polyprenylbenzoate decarboxylase
LRLPEGFREPRVVFPGVMAIQAPPFSRSPPANADIEPAIARFCSYYSPTEAINAFPLIVLVDESDFTARHLNHFLWVTFTRSNPAADVHGIGAGTLQKHWGCRGALVIDARIKPWHAPPLEADPEVSRRIDALAAPGKPLHGIF